MDFFEEIYPAKDISVTWIYFDRSGEDFHIHLEPMDTRFHRKSVTFSGIRKFRLWDPIDEDCRETVVGIDYFENQNTEYCSWEINTDCNTYNFDARSAEITNAN